MPGWFLTQKYKLKRLRLMWQPSQCWKPRTRPQTSLEDLDLCTTRITDAGLKHLATLKNLRRLKLVNTQITDAGIESLGRLTNLKHLDIGDTQISLDGANKLRAVLPGCQIER